MNFDGLLTTIVLLALVLIFGSILRRSANLRLHFWFIAWTFILFHCVVQWLGFPGATPAANETLVVDSLICAGVAFLCALCSITQKHYLFLISGFFGLPICAFCALHSFGINSPLLLSSLVLGASIAVVAIDLIAGERGPLLALVIAANLFGTSLVTYFLFHAAPDWALATVLGGIYLFNAILFYNHFRRVSIGVLTSIFGFITWGLVFPLALFLGIHYPGFHPPPVLWNLPKFFVAVGMILTLMEEEAKSAAHEALRNRDLYDRSQCGLFRVNWNGIFLDCNDSMARIGGYHSRLDLLGRSAVELYENPTDRETWAAELLVKGVVENVELRYVRGSGDIRIVLLNATLQRNERGEPQEIEGAVLDVTEHRRLHQQLEWQAKHDPLTGLPNRTMIDQCLRQATARAERRGTQVALLCVDLDRFKFVNDNYGHGTGDEYLRQLANRLSTCIRKGDLFGRFGGDEFVVVLDNLRSEDDALQMAMELIQSLAAPLQVRNQQFSASISIGLALYPQDADTPANLHSNADHALYRAKELGRNQCQCYSRCRSSIDDDTELERYLEYGLQENRFVLHYQPQVYADRASCGVEALLRFQHPTRGLLFPDDFLHIAEKNGLLHRVGEWVIQEACRQARIWRSQGLQLTMSVNVSAVQFTSADFAEAAARILQDEAMPPHSLEMELTESLLLSNLDESVRQMNRLKQLGVRIAIDDFGTGYSSLSYLHRLPIDVIKIDRLFLEKITEPQGTYPIVTAILSLAKALKVETVAEGIETEVQLALLTELGSQRFQGYLFSKPLPASDIPHFLQKTHPAPPFLTV